MEPFRKVTAVAAPIDPPNIDTDQIIPARFLRRPRDDRYASYLFHDLRLDDHGREKPDFVLNQTPWREAKILVADRNFGCGSSRESAVYALMAYGIRAVIAPSFGDIFYNNSFKNGFLPVRLHDHVCAQLRRLLHTSPGGSMTVDLEAQTVTGPGGETHHFEIEGYRRHALLNGLDDIEFTLAHAADIDRFETRYKAETPWL